MAEPNLIDRGIHCILCGYDLRGTDFQSDCPECGGKVIESLTASRGITKREVALLACRILALWMFVLGGMRLLSNLAMIVYNYAMGEIAYDAIWFMYLVVIPAISMAIGFVLWLLAGFIGSRMVRVDGPAIPNNSWTSRDLMTVAVCVLGIYITVTAIEGLAGSVLSFYIKPIVPGDEFINWPGFVFRIILGLILIFGRESIAALIQRARTVGVPESQT